MGKRRAPKPPEPDFTGGAIHALSPHRGTTGDPETDRQVLELVRDWHCTAGEELIAEMIITALKIGRDPITVGDLKLINRALKEVRAANRVFSPYRHRRKIVVYGSARTKPGRPDFDAAAEFARRMLREGYMTITGAGEGIMGAAQQGAGRDESFGLNINLPFEQNANATIEGDHKLIDFNYFFTRKLTFVKEADACALFPGGFGTMDECFESLTLMQTGKAMIYPLVMVDAPGGTYWQTFVKFIKAELLDNGMISEEDFAFFKVTDDVGEAVAEITGFYRNFHSYRYVNDQLVIRLLRPLTESRVAQLNDEFNDLFAEGGSGKPTAIRQGEALNAEKNEPEIADLPRLIFRHNRSRFGRLRSLIDAVNDPAGFAPE